MNNITHLSEVFNSFNNIIYSIRMEMEVLKREVLTIKTNVEKLMIDSSKETATNDTSLLVEQIQGQLTNLEAGLFHLVERDIPSIKEQTLEVNEKVAVVDKKITNVDKALKESKQDISSKVSKEEVQSIIDDAISVLIGNVKPTSDDIMLQATETPVFVSLEPIAEVDENIVSPVMNDTVSTIVVESIEQDTIVVDAEVETKQASVPVSPSPKPAKGRGRTAGRGKKVTQ
jgi:hypothetical protein